MTKLELAGKIAEESGVSRDSVMNILNVFMNVMSETLVAGESIYLRGLGTFESKIGGKTTGRNISQGTVISFPPQRRVKFIAGKTLKKRLKNPKKSTGETAGLGGAE